MITCSWKTKQDKKSVTQQLSPSLLPFMLGWVGVVKNRQSSDDVSLMPQLSFHFISFFYTTLNITTDMCRRKREGEWEWEKRKCWNITHQDYCTLSQTSSFMSNICFISSPFCEKWDRWDEKRDAYKKLCDQINVYSVYFTISFNSHLAKKWQNETSLVA